MYAVTHDKARTGLVSDILLDYLMASSAADWPGADGLTLDDILNAYASARAAEIPVQPQLLRCDAKWDAEGTADARTRASNAQALNPRVH
jgi:hypothetical protein